jgi:hypothetical protein
MILNIHGTMYSMFAKRVFNFFIIIFILVAAVVAREQINKPQAVLPATTQQTTYWFELLRASNIENLYKGVPGDKTKSVHMRSFRVKTGIPGERPTPLPQLVGRKYWKIIAKEAQPDNPETAPYFLTLDIPAPSTEPYGPTPYNECNGPASTDASPGGQCSWVLPGAFGLHGVAGDNSRLSDTDPGSSGCIRHSDADIAYLYNLLDPEHEEIRYYVIDE